MAEPELDVLERWMFEVVTHAHGVQAGAASERAAAALPASLEDVFEPSASLSAAERIGIYGGMYFGRLVDVLVDEFPALGAHLGAERARELFRAYVMAHPSRHPNLNQLGGELPAFVAQSELDVPDRAFAAELAALERAIQDVFDAPRAEPLDVEALLAVPQGALAGVRIELVPAMRLLTLAYPVNGWYQSWRDGEPVPAPERSPSWLVLYRRDFAVWRNGCGLEEATLLGRLAAGDALGPALERTSATAGADAGRIAASLEGWFQDWTGMGLFAAVHVAGD